MNNTNKALEYIKNEYKNWQLEELDIKKHIQLNSSKIMTINNEISNIEAKLEKSDQSFHSVNYNDEDRIKLEELNSTREKIESENKSLNNELEIIARKNNSLLEILNDDEMDDKDKTKANKALLKNLEAERERISRDIHDSVVQSLTALIYRNEFIVQLIEQDSNRAKLELKDNEVVLKDCINELREIIYDLKPMSIEDFGFKEAFNMCCTKLNHQSNKQISYSFIGDDEVESIIGISIFRIITELTSNSIKYSKCSKINIKVKNTDKEIIIKHSDDGIGFDYDNQKQIHKDNTGFGLVMLRERVELLDGVISYSNTNGSTYTISIPKK